LKTTAMSSGELERVEVMGRVASGDLKLTTAANLLELSYRQRRDCGGAIGRWAGKEGALTLRPNYGASLPCAFQREHQQQKGIFLIS
jgi:hypothetical protein